MAADIATISFTVVFLAGLISFLSPCVLPLVPAYVSYIAGTSVTRAQEDRRWHHRLPAVGLSVFFVLGFSVVFVALGAGASVLGQMLLAYRYETNIIGGSIIVVFGLFMTGLVRMPRLHRDWRWHPDLRGGRPLSAFVLGVAFGFGWTPCIGPILGTILTASAVAATLNQGMALLAVYALGLSLPFILAAAFTDGLASRSRGLVRTGRVLNVVAGVIMILMGIAIITGYLSAFGFWLLRTFPVFATIG